MDFLQKIGTIWEKVSLVQRALLIALLLTCVIASALIVHWARRPDMRMLYEGLSPEEASQITEKIAEKGIAYDLRNGGTTVFVPNEKVYQLRLDMAKEGLPTDRQRGYGIFDKEKIGVSSPFVQSVNLKRALQDELAKSIQMIEGVVHARVHIVNSEQTLFTSDAGKTTASVVLQVRPGYRLSGSNVAAITHLVSGSVEALKSEDVTVIDSQGQLLSGDSNRTMDMGASTVQNYREKVERNLAFKAEEMLTTVLGSGRATVKVSALIDMNSINIVRKRYDDKAVAVEEEITGKTKPVITPASAEGGPSGPADPEKEDITKIKSLVGETVETRIELPGTIRSLSVAAFVDLTVPDVNDANSGGQRQLLMEVSEVEEIIKSALGLRETDSLKVKELRFYRPPSLLVEEEASSWPRYTAIARQASLGIMAICALLVLRIFGGAKKKAAAAAPAAAAAALPQGAEAVGLLPAGSRTSESIVLRKQIGEALRADPNQVVQLFSHWLDDRES